MTGVGGAVLLTAISADSVTGIMTVDVLLPGSGSGVAEDTDAVLAMLSDTSEPTFPRSRMISDAPAARVPSSRVPLQGRKVAPPSVEYTAPRIEEGTASLSATLCASDGPRLETVTVKRMGSPAVTGSGAAVFVTDTSADIAASTSTVEMVLLGSGSEASLLTTAVLKMMPEAEGDSVPRINTGWNLPLGKVPRFKLPAQGRKVAP